MFKYEPNCELSYRQDLNDELAIFRFRPLGWEFPEFTPGQYAEIAVVDDKARESGTVERRQYSIASSANSRGELEFYIVLVQGGYFTPQLWSMELGTKLWINPKLKGKFTLDGVPQDQNLIFVSTGTGLAPFVSMVRTYREAPPWRKVIVVHGVRYARDLGYCKELSKLAAEDSRIVYVPATTREVEGSDWKGLRGRIQTLFNESHVEKAAGIHLEPSSCQIFLCGNPAMIEEMQPLLESKGFKEHRKKDPGQIHLEKYW